MRYTKSVPAAVLALMFTAACDSAELVSPDPGAAPQLAAAPQAQVRTSDDEWARASRAEAPGFAGFYLQDDGTPVVRLVDGTKRGEVQRYIAQQIASARRGRNAGAPQQPVFLAAAHDFAQLKEWSEQLHPLLSRSDVYLIDVDEVGNRVSLGVADATAIGAVRSEAARLGIPASAVNVVTQGRPEPRATVRDRFTTTVGGIQIAFSQYLCTLGFNARRVSNSTNIYVTNAHCTGTQYANDGIAIYQNTVAAGNQIGNEVYDRPLYACTAGVASCRWADAAFISNNATRTIGQGGIARTAWAQNAPAPSLTVTGEYDVVGRFPSGSIAVGTWLDKTGRTSGSTYGQVTQSCVTIGVLRCQDVSSVWSEGGDSGSPMYVYLGGAGAAENDVQLYGILWGGPNNNWNVTYSSRLSGIETDLGTLTNLCRPGYGC
jgi:hypothetical protein